MLIANDNTQNVQIFRETSFFKVTNARAFNMPQPQKYIFIYHHLTVLLLIQKKGLSLTICTCFAVSYYIGVIFDRLRVWTPRVIAVWTCCFVKLRNTHYFHTCNKLWMYFSVKPGISRRSSNCNIPTNHGFEMERASVSSLNRTHHAIKPQWELTGSLCLQRLNVRWRKRNRKTSAHSEKNPKSKISNDWKWVTVTRMGKKILNLSNVSILQFQIFCSELPCSYFYQGSKSIQGQASKYTLHLFNTKCVILHANCCFNLTGFELFWNTIFSFIFQVLLWSRNLIPVKMGVKVWT